MHKPIATIRAPKQLLVSVKLEEQPDAKPRPVDVFEAYRIGTAMARSYPTGWIVHWGDWICHHMRVADLKESELRPLWEHIVVIHETAMKEAKKRNAAIADAIAEGRGLTAWLGPSAN